MSSKKVYNLDCAFNDIPIDAKKINEYGEQIIEVITRTEDGKISSIIKCLLREGEEIYSEVVNNSPIGSISNCSSVANISSKEQMRLVLGGIRNASKDLSNILNESKNISVNVDKIVNGMNVLKSVSFLNVALSSIDIGVNIVGFAIVNQKIDRMSQMLEEQAKKDIADIKSEVEDLISDAIDIIERNRNNNVKETECADFLNDSKKYIRKLITRIFDTNRDFEIYYSLIMKLLPYYTEVIKISMIISAYNSNKSSLSKYKKYTDILNHLISEEFLEKLFDIVFFENKCSKSEAEQAQGIHYLMVCKAYTDFSDTRELINFIPTREAYDTFEKNIFCEAKRRIVESLPEKNERCDFSILKEEISRLEFA